MKDKKILFKILGLLGMGLGVAVTMLNEYNTKEDLKSYIDEKISEREERESQ